MGPGDLEWSGVRALVETVGQLYQAGVRLKGKHVHPGDLPHRVAELGGIHVVVQGIRGYHDIPNVDTGI